MVNEDNPYGSGPRLTMDGDFAVGTDGDLAITSGTDELGKDVSYVLMNYEEDIVGGNISGNEYRKIEENVRELLSNMGQIKQVLSVYATSTSSPNEVALHIKVVGVGGETLSRTDTFSR